MKQHAKICAVILAGVLLFAAAGLILFHLGYLPWVTKNIPGNAPSFLAGKTARMGRSCLLGQW